LGSPRAERANHPGSAGEARSGRFAFAKDLLALAEQEKEHEIRTFHGARRVRHIGDPLHLAREPRSILDNIRASVGEYNFASQYQQAPVPLAVSGIGGSRIAPASTSRHLPIS
jgi:hypothetical protein